MNALGGSAPMTKDQLAAKFEEFGPERLFGDGWDVWIERSNGKGVS